MSVRRLHSGPRMSQAVIHGNTAYLAGQVATDPKPTVAEQTKQILAQIDALLKEAGTDKSKLLTATIWLTDIATFNQMNGGVGCMGVAGQHAGARHGAGLACRQPVSRRDHGDRRHRLIARRVFAKAKFSDLK